MAQRAQSPRRRSPSSFIRLYNPEVNTQYNIVPGLLGIILTMTMVLMTSMALTRERERGTYENLLAMPTHPVEIMIGKIAPNILVGLIQSALVLLAAKLIFGVPMLGSLALLSGVLVIFIAANLAVGYTFSTIAQTQLQAMQMMVFFLLAVDPAFRLCVSVPRHAGLGAVDRRSPAGDAFPARGARHPAEGKRSARDLARRLAADSLSVRGWVLRFAHAD